MVFDSQLGKFAKLLFTPNSATWVPWWTEQQHFDFLCFYCLLKFFKIDKESIIFSIKLKLDNLSFFICCHFQEEVVSGANHEYFIVWIRKQLDNATNSSNSIIPRNCCRWIYLSFVIISRLNPISEGFPKRRSWIIISKVRGFCNDFFHPFFMYTWR